AEAQPPPEAHARTDLRQTNRCLIAKYDFSQQLRQEVPTRNFARAARGDLRGDRSKTARRCQHARRGSNSGGLRLRDRRILRFRLAYEHGLHAREIEATQHRTYFELAGSADLAEKIDG